MLISRHLTYLLVTPGAPARPCVAPEELPPPFSDFYREPSQHETTANTRQMRQLWAEIKLRRISTLCHRGGRGAAAPPATSSLEVRGGACRADEEDDEDEDDCWDIAGLQHHITSCPHWLRALLLPCALTANTPASSQHHREHGQRLAAL